MAYRVSRLSICMQLLNVVIVFLAVCAVIWAASVVGEANKYHDVNYQAVDTNKDRILLLRSECQYLGASISPEDCNLLKGYDEDRFLSVLQMSKETVTFMVAEGDSVQHITVKFIGVPKMLRTGFHYVN